jgi:hypothetical protein
MTISALKNEINSRLRMPEQDMKLSCGGRIPDDDMTLIEAGVDDCTTMQLGIKVRGGMHSEVVPQLPQTRCSWQS